MGTDGAHLAVEAPLVSLDVEAAWAGLSAREKRYAHHFARASWAGQLVTAAQTSCESPLILKLIFSLFREDSAGLASRCSCDEATAGHWSSFLDYCCFCVGNLGNYRSVGNTKVVPALPKNAFDRIVAKAARGEDVGQLWSEAREAVYSLEPHVLQLGFPPAQRSGYFLGGATQADAELANRFLTAKGLEAWNTRLERRPDDTLVVWRASVEASEGAPEVFEGVQVVLAWGDHREQLRAIVEHLGAAKDFSEGGTQTRMIENLRSHFCNGDIELHKEASKDWVRDSAPTIETTIGFIETDRDPAGVRAEFEGFVAIVNKDVSRKFGILVERAEELLQRLPWGNGFEKDNFIKPEFTSLDVLAFCSGSLPLGICLPNYDDVRSGVGFKNVDLGNVCTARSSDTYSQFLSAADAELFCKTYAKADQVLTGLHELIGHGSGKLLREEGEGALNYSKKLINPCTCCPVTTHYKAGETYGAVFGSVASAMEECRAETVSLYLGVDADIQAIFGFEGRACEDSVYAGWLGMCWLGLKAMEHYDPEKQAWGAVHGRARFAILRHLLEVSDDGKPLITLDVDKTQEPPDVTLSMDRALIRGVGRAAIGELLLEIHVARCIAAPGMARRFEALTTLPAEWLAIRDIVVARKRPRDIFVQPVTVLDEASGQVTLQTYPCTREGLIQSFADRFEGM